MRCLFCQIIRGEVHAHIVLDDEHVLGFLDHRPLFAGHVLVVPRQHFETLADLPVELVGPLFGFVRDLSRAVPEAVGAQGTFVATNNRISQSVPHLHIHVVPRARGDGLRGFFWPRTKYAGVEEMDEVATRVREALARIRG